VHIVHSLDHTVDLRGERGLRLMAVSGQHVLPLPQCAFIANSAVGGRAVSRICGSFSVNVRSESAVSIPLGAVRPCGSGTSTGGQTRQQSREPR
jgi:hypothetical protein